MDNPHWTYVKCGDIRFKNRSFRLGRIRRGITLAAPAADVTVWDLDQAEELRATLDRYIEDLRCEVTPPNDQ